LSRIPIY